MAKRQLFDEVGLFDEQFGLAYNEDIDFMRRMDKAEKKYASTKAVNIFHIINATAFGMPEIKDLMNKNRELLDKKWSVEPETSAVAPGENNSEPDGGVELEIWGSDVPDAVSNAPKTAETTSPLVRTPATGDKVFYVKEDKAHWVTSPEVLAALGYTMGDVKDSDNASFFKYEYGDKITLENVKDYVKS